jgi:hypothetical protein
MAKTAVIAGARATKAAPLVAPLFDVSSKAVVQGIPDSDCRAAALWAPSKSRSVLTCITWSSIPRAGAAACRVRMNCSVIGGAEGLTRTATLVAAGCNSRSSFTTMQADTLVIGPYIFFSSRKEQLGALSLRHAVPAIVAAGGLMSYGGNEAESVWSASTPEKFSKERTRWSARPKVDQDRADNQPQDREDARPHNAALAARYCRRGDRIRPATSGIGPSRHFAAKQHFGRFWREADINRQARPPVRSRMTQLRHLALETLQ